ncbi:MAG TPA: hypothetical protein VIK73_04085 [Limnochordales bacterium]
MAGSNALHPDHRIGVVQIGLGPIGQGIVRRVLDMPGVRLVGAVDPAPDKAGQDVGTLVGRPPVGIEVQPRFDPGALAGACVALHSTGSHLESVMDQLLALVEAGLSVISTCEELAWPWYHHPEPAQRLDRAARQAGVTVLGTGVNPGFVMDLFPLVVTGVCTRVEHVYARRVVDASRRRGPLQRKIGSGLTPEEFDRLVAEGRLGHIGLPESAALVAAGLRWRVDRIDNVVRPLIASRPIETPYLSVRPGQVQGLFQTVTAWEGDRERVRLDLVMALDPPESEDAPAADSGRDVDHLRITGEPPLQVVVPGGIFGDTATVAAVTNAIPRVMDAPPGLLSVKDLAAPGWWSGAGW